MSATQPTNSSHDLNTLPVAVIGAGPVGLAAAVHLLDQGLRPVVLEAGRVAESIRAWGHVRLFSPWGFNIDPRAREILEADGWSAPNDDLHPTGRELVERYLEPLAATSSLAPHLRLATKVLAVSRLHRDKMKDTERPAAPFLLQLQTSDGGEEQLLARAVIDASGTWGHPNPMAAHGLPALGEQRHAERIRYGIPNILGHDRPRYAGRRTLVVGSGHSAFNALLELIELRQQVPGTEILWAIRGPADGLLFKGRQQDQLAERGRLGQAMEQHWRDGDFTLLDDFRIQAVEADRQDPDRRLEVIADGTVVDRLDEIIVATGFRPDLELLREVRLDLDPSTESPRTLAPLIDPNIHSCGTVPPHGAAELQHPEEGFYIVGMKSYGRAPTFLLRTGYEQVRSVAHALAGDWQGARRVELTLPETGACKAPLPGLAKSVGSACCG